MPIIPGTSGAELRVTGLGFDSERPLEGVGVQYCGWLAAQIGEAPFAGVSSGEMVKGKASEGGLGKTVIKARFKGGRSNQNTTLHTTGLADGASWMNMRSITEQDDLEELLQVAQLSGADFAAERASPTIVSTSPSLASAGTGSKAKEGSREWIRIPRRPKWDKDMASGELCRLEEEAFLDWRRDLAKIEDAAHFIITPFERNLEVWRQLWRVVEACDTIVQIVDARNPLLYHCEDLLRYMKEVGPHKEMYLLINKADFLLPEQRQMWGEYLRSIGLDFVFYSAKQASALLEGNADADVPVDLSSGGGEAFPVMGRDQLLDHLKGAINGKVAMVGYPNVGKSSTINTLAGAKKVAVAATPGKTKHFQTIILENGIVLYDCPGLVFPNFAASKADLVLNGILPIDQLREWVSPAELLLQRIPRNIIQRTYGIELPQPSVEEDANRKPTASELLSSYAISRGFMTSFHGNPDESRAARFILKDYVNGKLLFCNPPPGEIGQEKFNSAMYQRLEAELPARSVRKAVPTYSARGDAALTADHSHGVALSGMSGTKQFAKASGTGKKHFKGGKRGK